MEQRRLRLGDILDDYCPRERRVTNHAVVAMIEEDVKQTRCTTCDAEHVYKGGKPPRRKKAESTGALYKEVLAGLTDQEAAATRALPADEADEASPVFADSVELVVPPAEAGVLASPEPIADPEDEDIQPDMPPVDEGPVHRQLIRAQLPRVEGVKLERQAPDFTIRQNNGRGGNGQGHYRGGPNGGGRKKRERLRRRPQRGRGGGGGGPGGGRAGVRRR